MTEQVSLPPTSRFQIYASPIVHPGKCAVCGAVDQPVLDFGLNIDFYGAVMFCVTNCLPEAARAIGMVPREEVKAVEERLAQSLGEQLRSTNRVGVSRELWDDLVVGISGLSDRVLFDVPSDNSLVLGQAAQASIGSDEEPESDLFSAVGSIEQDDQSSVSEGPASVSSGSSNGSLDL